MKNPCHPHHPRLKFPVLNVIHEDADLLVVQKPAGLVCHPTKDGEMSSLIGRVRLYLVGRASSRDGAIVPEQSGAGPSAASPHLINRLDRETSGIVLIAKNSRAAGELGKIFESRAVEKEYLVIVHGHVATERGTIDAPLGKDEQSIVAIKDCVRPDGAPAQTAYWVEHRFVRDGRAGSPLPAARPDEIRGAHGVTRPTNEFSLLRLIPRTGRKHQIRIHLAHLGHPIVGDKLYGGDEDCYLAFVQRRLTEAQRARLILENHALHARALQFSWRGLPLEFACPPEPWFTEFINAKSQSF
jgi:23S rRNA pseudouridine1911/1915/1917 synthase